MGGESSLKKVLLYSGGMDSWLIDKLWKPDIKLYVNMHTEYSQQEIERLPTDVKVVDFPYLNQYSLPNSIIPLRNLYLYCIAANETGFEDVSICLGALNGDRINDKTQEFADRLNDLLQYLYQPQQSQPGRNIHIVMPYKQNSKRELCEEYVRQGGTLREIYEKSFTCYHPEDGHECLSCKACFRKAIPFIVAGMQFTNDEKRKIIKYMNNYVLLNMDDFTKNKGKEGEDCRTAIGIIKQWENE